MRLRTLDPRATITSKTKPFDTSDYVTANDIWPGASSQRGSFNNTGNSFLSANRFMKTIETSDSARIKKSIDTHSILDSVPGGDHNQHFGRLLRPRDRSREIGSPAMKIKTHNDLDRLNVVL